MLLRASLLFREVFSLKSLAKLIESGAAMRPEQSKPAVVVG
jgi:hypothetical protein